MDMKIRLWIVCILCFYSFFSSGKSNNAMERFRQQFADEAVQGAIDNEHVFQIMHSMKADGTWADIDYADLRAEGFLHTRHLERLVEMSKAYRRIDSPLRGDKQLWACINKSLNYWLDHDFQCQNWWYNQIGVPTDILRLLYILDECLSTNQREQMLRIAGRANMHAPGARPSGDRIRIAALCAKTMLFERKTGRVEQMLKVIESEMAFYNEKDLQAKLYKGYFSAGHGLECDYSFHHRPDNVNNTLTYGESFLESFMDWARNVANTQYRFKESTIHRAVDFYLDGMCKQMVYGVKADPNVMNRDMTRKGESGRVCSITIPSDFLKITSYRSKELSQIIDNRRGNIQYKPAFSKMFFTTDYFVFQRPDYYTSVRLFSTRCANMEMAYNGEGLLNHFRADGANYLSITGNEYTDIYPTFDYRKVPGTTTVQKETMPDAGEIQKMGLTSFVGGVYDGKYGAATFDFVSPSEHNKAKKSWFFFDKGYVCLGAGITGNKEDTIATTLNQCYLNGDVILCKENNKVIKLSNGIHATHRAKWLMHDGVSYIFPGGNDEVRVYNGPVAGSWSRINKQTRADSSMVTNNIFTLWINHGSCYNSPKTYSYIIMPGLTRDETAKASEFSPYILLSNTDTLQAVSCSSEGIAYAVFYTSGRLRINENLCIATADPGMVLVKFSNKRIDYVTVSDPTHKLEKFHMYLNQSGKGREVNIKLPRNQNAGDSVTKKL